MSICDKIWNTLGYTSPRDFDAAIRTANREGRLHSYSKRDGDQWHTQVLNYEDPETIAHLTQILTNMRISWFYVWTHHSMRCNELVSQPSGSSSRFRLIDSPAVRLQIEVSRDDYHPGMGALVTVCRLDEKGNGSCAYTQMPI